MKNQQEIEWIKWQLNDLAATPAEDIETGSFEVYGEDEQGREGSCEVEIPDLAQQALDVIKQLQGQQEGQG